MVGSETLTSFLSYNLCERLLAIRTLMSLLNNLNMLIFRSRGSEVPNILSAYLSSCTLGKGFLGRREVTYTSLLWALDGSWRITREAKTCT